MPASLQCVDPKEYTCEKGLLVVNWAQVHSQNLAAVVYRGLLHTLLIREKPQSGCQASCSGFLPPEPTLIKEFPESCFDRRAKTCLSPIGATKL